MADICEGFTVNPACIGVKVATGVANSASALAGSIFEKLATDTAAAAAELVTWSMAWWVATDSVDPGSEAVSKIQDLMVPVIVVVIAASILNQAIRMMVTRRKDPALNVALGLIKFAAVNLVALFLLREALKAGDEFSVYLINESSIGFQERLTVLLKTGSKEAVILTFLVSLIVVLLALIQWGLSFFRQAGILVLAGLVTLAASGSINDSTKPWLSKMLPWLIALVLYKPMAACIYAIGFILMGEGQDFSTILTGLVTMVLATVALPAMMRFFSWSQTAITSGGGSGGALAGAATGAASLAALQSSRSIDSSGPGTGPRPSGSSSPGGSSSSPAGSDSRGGSAGPSAPGNTGGGGGPGLPPGPGSGPGPTGSSGAAVATGTGGAAGGGAAASGAAGGAAAAAGPAGAAAAAAVAAKQAATGAASQATNSFTPPEE